MKKLCSFLTLLLVFTLRQIAAVAVFLVAAAVAQMSGRLSATRAS